MVVELRFFYTIIFATSAPQIRRHQQEPVNVTTKNKKYVSTEIFFYEVIKQEIIR